ncbi:sugar ABC transporter permease [Synergistales bacterium]|nr:sugar ABC transporter permease [Synergistales bacterium]
MAQGLGKIIKSENNIFQLAVITICTFALMCWLLPGTFLTMRNFRSMSFQFPELGILSLAMMLAMLTGGIDLSLVGIANLASILGAFVFVKLMPANSSHEVVVAYIVGVVALALFVGMSCGLLNGFLISKLNVPPILATLGTMQFYTGIAIVLTKGAAVIGLPTQYSVIGNGSLGVFSIPLIIFIVLLIFFAILLRKTNFGINLYLIGSNAKAAIFSGIKVNKNLMISYMIGGCLAGLAGLIMSSRTNAAKADYGTSYILQSILVAVLGGVKPTGGSGKAIGILIAVLALQFLSSGFSMLRFSNFAKEFVWGVFLLAIMIVNYFTNERNKT